MFSLIAILAVFVRVDAQTSTEPCTNYSARREKLVAPIIEQFSEATDIEVEVRYGNLAEMVVMILAEGENSPADVFFAQDASGLGALARDERLVTLPNDLLEGKWRLNNDRHFHYSTSNHSSAERVVAYENERSRLEQRHAGETGELWHRVAADDLRDTRCATCRQPDQRARTAQAEHRAVIKVR